MSGNAQYCIAQMYLYKQNVISIICIGELKQESDSIGNQIRRHSFSNIYIFFYFNSEW